LATKVSSYTVVLDACVLYPAPLRDFLMELAASGLYRAKWTDEIHDEWTRNVLKNRTDLQPEQLARTRTLMDNAVLGAKVTGYEALVPSILLLDKKDRHVVAAAIRARADAIITFNLKDFPPTALGAYDIEVQHPDEFLLHQLGLDEPTVVVAAQACRARLSRPPMSADEYLDTLERQSLPRTVAELRPYAAVL
jgi:predicted nucleic acid-binding protein